MLSWNII